MNGTVYIQFEGQLCNQIFQISAGYALSKKFNKKLVIFYDPHKPWEFKNLEYFKDFNIVPTDYFIKQNCIPLHEMNFSIYFSFNLEPIQNYYFRGYFQNEKYFKEYYSELYSIFFNQDLLNTLKVSFPKWETSYFIHYRRTDYLTNGALNVDLEKYFPIAIKYITDLDPDAHFYICSDDLEYCKGYFKDINLSFVENLDAIETLHLLTICNKGGICSNSTFSWMGGYYNQNPLKKILFPSKWMTNDTPIDIWFENSIKINI